MSDISEMLKSIREVAVKKAEQGIAVHRAKLASSPVSGDVGKKLQEAVKISPAVASLASRYSAEVVARFLEIFQEGLAAFTHAVSGTVEFPSAPRTGDGEIILYPDGTRFLHSIPQGNGQQYGFVVVEQPPQVRTLIIGTGEEYVPMPYVVFVVYFSKNANGYYYSGLYVAFNTKPLRTLEDVVYSPTLPNCGNFSVCMGHYDGVRNVKSLVEVVDDVIGTFWQSAFGDEFPPFKVDRKKISTWGAWGKLPPLDMLKADFGGGMPLRNLVKWEAENSRASLSNVERRELANLVQLALHKMTQEFTTDEVVVLLQNCSQEIIETVVKDLTLQPE